MGKVSGVDESAAWRWNVHGHVVEVECADGRVTEAAQRLWRGYLERDVPPGVRATRGSVMPYDADAIARHLPSGAEVVSDYAGLAEIWQDPAEAGRFWLVDERWGMAEVDLPRGRWRAWVMPTGGDGVKLLERAVLWPMAQLLRTRGLHALPAASLDADGWGLMIISPFNIEPELRRLGGDGLALIGQRWTALREEGDRVAMLRLPGPVEAGRGPRSPGSGPQEPWVDLVEETGSPLRHGFCDTVLIVSPGRRGGAEIAPVGQSDAAAALRSAWPIPELAPGRSHATLAARIAQRAAVYRVEMSPDAEEFSTMVDLVRPTSPPSHHAKRRHFVAA